MAETVMEGTGLCFHPERKEEAVAFVQSVFAFVKLLLV